MRRADLVRRRLRSAVRRRRPRAGILMYHAIRRQDPDPWGICVRPEHFDDQLAVLAERRRVVDAGAIAAGEVYAPDGGAVAVTFDDGYADNLTAALPLLEKYEIPATVFVIGNALGRPHDFWWEALERAVLLPRRLPDRLHFPFGTGARIRPVHVDDDPAGLAGWRADEQPPVTARQQLFRDLWDEIVVLEPAAQDDAAAHLTRWAGADSTPDPHRRSLTVDEFLELAGHPLITIGGHTLDHPSLIDWPAERQHAQIAAGNARLTELTGTPVTRLSYPYGRHDASARRAVAGLGLDFACTSSPEATIGGDDPFALPRIQVPDVDGDEFDRMLSVRHRLTGARKPGQVSRAAR